MSTAAGPLRQAIYDALTGDVTLMGKLGAHPTSGRKVYEFVAEAGALFPLIVLGTQDEFALDTYGADGNAGGCQVSVHDRPADEGVPGDTTEARDVYGDVVRVLEAGPLTVSGKTAYPGRMSLLGTLYDGTTKDVSMVGRYETVTSG